MSIHCGICSHQAHERDYGEVKEDNNTLVVYKAFVGIPQINMELRKMDYEVNGYFLDDNGNITGMIYENYKKHTDVQKDEIIKSLLERLKEASL